MPGRIQFGHDGSDRHRQVGIAVDDLVQDDRGGNDMAAGIARHPAFVQPAVAIDMAVEQAPAADRGDVGLGQRIGGEDRSEEHTSELQSLMRISYAVFCLKKKNTNYTTP